MDAGRPLTDTDRQAAVAALRSHAGAGAIDLEGGRAWGRGTHRRPHWA